MKGQQAVRARAKARARALSWQARRSSGALQRREDGSVLVVLAFTRQSAKHQFKGMMGGGGGFTVEAVGGGSRESEGVSGSGEMEDRVNEKMKKLVKGLAVGWSEG